MQILKKWKRYKRELKHALADIENHSKFPPGTLERHSQWTYIRELEERNKTVKEFLKSK